MSDHHTEEEKPAPEGGERALDEDVPDEASGGGQGTEQESRPNVQEGLEEDEGSGGGVEEIAERSD